MQHSDFLNELATALAKAQGAFTPAIKDSAAKIQSNKPGGANYSYKFADLAAVVDACRGPLSSNGLAVMQPPESSADGFVSIHTMLVHSSGQWMASTMTINFAGEDIKKLGSAITYIRRYAWMAMLGIVADEDDDGDNAPQMQHRQQARDYPRQAPIEEKKPGRDLSSREAINEEFRPRAIEQRKQERKANDKEFTKLDGDIIGAKGLDVRLWVKVVSTEVEIANDGTADYREGIGLGRATATNSYEVEGHMLKATVAANGPDPRPMGPDGKPKGIGPGKVSSHLANLYLDPQWREWMREELKEYVAGKKDKAIKEADDELARSIGATSGELVGAGVQGPADDTFEADRQ